MVKFLIKTGAPLALLLFFVLPGVAQTLFFDRLPTTTWLVAASEYGALPLGQRLALQVAKDTTGTRTPATVQWLFRERLVVRRYDGASGRMVTVGSYVYPTDRAHASLRIFFDERAPLSYRVGITSTGGTAVLLRQRARRSAG
ncbi:hypothetical protein Q5H92_16745 [Hymenobacter sp. M29]|uniref:DUF4426 domain-containing protein n=1 Tax=Hymenobacter mellowenesis TaxID=3063995 RepID=A0ABT9AFV7_9BACT|nr:hypothetical protein [Hymenobacter sp. M29]MDO7848015.1 hypothetical protein [Hymenobacter sp. M29]